MDKFNQFSHAKLYFVSHCNDTVHCWLFTVISFIVLFYSVFLVVSWIEGAY